MTAELPPTIDQQIREVEAVYLSREAQVRQRNEAIRAGRQVPPDTGCISSSLPTLSAALRTLTWVRDNRDRLISESKREIVKSGDLDPASGLSSQHAGRVSETFGAGR